MLAALTALLLPALAGSVLVVGPGGPYRTIREALDAARPGDTVEVHGGVHPGPILVDRPVALVGVDAPIIDGGGRGTVLTVSAPGAAVRGLVVRSSGSDLNAGDAGIEVRAADVLIEGNRLEDVLHGISLDNAPRAVIRGNQVRGKDLAAPERGDGLRLWYSSGVLVEGNEVEAARDCVVWYSERVRLVNNRVRGGRYGLHFMYNDGAELIGNELRGNSVGAYVMYSRGLLLRDNLLVANRGPSGFGLGLKDVDNIVAEGNWIVDNRVGIWVDTSPRSLDAESRFHRNLLALNDVAVTLQPSTQRNSFWENEFRDNLQQVSVQGGGQLRGNQWAVEGRGNYWSDYRGFDFDGDGVGDLPYRAEGAFSDLMDRHPEMRLFQFGLAAGAIEFAAQAFPLLRPPPRLEDPAPLMALPAIPPLAAREAADAGPAAGVALGLLTLAGSILGLSRTQPRGRGAPLLPGAGEVVLAVSHLHKRFGRQVAVDDLSFSVAPGEIVALWGPNGAGKTTALKCILGLLPCQGEISVAGLDARRHGKRARRLLGYVPQEVALHDDLSVAATAAFYARLRRVPAADAEALLASLGLADHLRKPVGALSGGQRQRLVLALALLGDPPLLLLDEPTSNLDAAGREQILRDLAALRARGKAILFCSHRLEEVEAIADRVLVLERGRLAFTCAPHDLARRLGLRLSLKLRVAEEAYSEAVAALRAGGLTPSPNGSGIRLQVLPAEKALPIRLLERAGIAVIDFSIEDGAAHGANGEEP